MLSKLFKTEEDNDLSALLEIEITGLVHGGTSAPRLVLSNNIELLNFENLYWTYNSKNPFYKNKRIQVPMEETFELNPVELVSKILEDLNLYKNEFSRDEKRFCIRWVRDSILYYQKRNSAF
ncbi:MAG: hypothetical protein ACRDD2_07840 [Sarcina sp.]